ncbi:MAG: sucrase ferredoxin [Gaiellaceae bacterium]
MTSASCSDMSLAAGESLSASATTAEHWLLLEVSGSWPRDVSANGALSASAQDAVTRWHERTPGSRLLFIRRPGRAASSPLAFLVHATEVTAEVRRIALEHPRDLVDVDFERDGDREDRQLVLVCGHGSRDACCARRGVAVYGALAERLTDDVELWISSHQGGHRFAGNVLVLPAGLQFGRLDPQNAAAVVSGALEGRIELDRYRGRTFHAQPIQAAEQAVREALGLDSVADLHLAGVEGGIVRFRGQDGAEYQARVDEIVGPIVPASCGAEPEAQKSFSARTV